MMRTFIDDVLIDLLKTGKDLSKLTFILPSKRAGNFLKNSIYKFTDKTLFSPQILSIEEFIENISLLKNVPNTELLFELYSVYLEVTPKKEVDEFAVFCKWAQIIIQDFNEVDRYLIPPENIFTYLSDIKEVNHWSVEEKTELIKKYLSFWEKLPVYYKTFTERLISKGLGYQGLLYREAVEKLELYIEHNPKKHHIFLGFNALNNAEQKIIQELLHQDIADIYWDIDSHFLDSKFHDAGLFAREHKEWKYFQKNTFKWKANNYRTEKNITLIGVPKNIGQAKYIGELLSEKNQSLNNLHNTAVVLGDESLLNPLLNSIPNDVGAVNITMGMPLHLAPIASLFNSLFLLHKTNAENQKIYFKDVVSITSSPFLAPLFNISEGENITVAHNYISKNNITHIGLEKLKSLFSSNKVLIELLFGSWENSSKIGLETCKQIIQSIKNNLNQEKKDNLLALEYLFKFNQVFNQITLLISKYDYAKDIKTLMMLYKEVLSKETLDFQGEPLKGLQIIGMLESRVIDFETVIISSVNEGVLPSGKSNNSFIPFDVKLEYGLPTYKEKDAVYAYHFYHLLQRAKNIYILYNTEVDALNGGEKSRFITQLEVEGIGVHNITHYSVSPKVPTNNKELKSIKKTDDVMVCLKDIASRGFSPSSLTSYIRNPLDFYYQKVLGVNTYNDVEETVAHNTFGTIIHNVLEDLYTDYINAFLDVEGLSRMKNNIDKLVKTYFLKEFKDGNTTVGKNLIIFEITKRYIFNFLEKEIEQVKNGKRIKIIALEKKLEVSINISELKFPVRLKGTVDRIDECDGVLRIIDYKTGNVSQNKVEVVNWEDITTDYDKYSKSFQVLAYAYMMHLETPFKNPVEGGIISFKNLKSGLLKFGKKESPRAGKKDNSISEETLSFFSNELKKLIIEICNPDIDFVEKEV